MNKQKERLEVLIAYLEASCPSGLIMYFWDGSKKRIEAGEAIHSVFDGIEGIAYVTDTLGRRNGYLADMLNDIIRAGSQAKGKR